jgi:hypothetical protein
MRLTPHLLASSLLALAACSSGATPEGNSAPTPPPPTATAAAPVTQAPVPTGGGLVGTWSSPSCGPRTYERRISFAADGTFSAEDRVSPCPPGVVCVWAGIVNRHGKYAPLIGSIQLTVEGPGGGPGQPLPEQLAQLPGGGLAEPMDDGQRCPYARMP